MTRVTGPDTNPGMAEQASPGSVVSDFEAVYARHFGLVWRTLRRFGVPLWLVEDAAQDVFLIWYRQRGGFRGDAQVSSYLYSIARRVAANVRRTAQRTERRHQALLVGDYYDGDRAAPDPEEAVADRQAAAAFRRAVAGLPPKLREVYLLSAQDGLTAQQIGLALGLSANTVSSRIRLTRARLESELRAQLPDAFPHEPAGPVAEARSRVWALLLPLLPRESAAVEAGRAAPLLALAAAVGLVAVLVLAALRSPVAGPPRGPVARAPGAAAPVSSGPALPAPEPVQVQEAPAPAPAPVRVSADAGDALAREARMLAAAQRRLRGGDPDAALSQLRLHATRFADGVLAEERDALIAAALCQRGERALGLAATDELAARAPGSAALSTARAACDERPNKPSIDE